MTRDTEFPNVVALPPPAFDDGPPFADVLRRRRSIRAYSDAALTLAEVSQVLWAAQGVTDPREGLRTAPSGGALYPLEVYLAVARVNGLPAGVYKYRPGGHKLTGVRGGNPIAGLARAALDQECVRDAAVVIVLAAVYDRMTRKYGRRGIQYVDNEVGLAAENVLLQVVAAGLGSVVVGAFDEDKVGIAVGLANNEVPACLLPVGRPR